MGIKLGVVTLGAFAAASGLGWLYQSQATDRLRTELAIQRDAADELARLRAERERLVAARVADSELEALRADHAAVARLRREIAALNQRAVETAPPNSAPGKNWMTAMVPAKEWRNAGRATPLATFETGLWAAAGGDMDALAQLLSLDEAGRARWDDLYAGLPETVRANYRSPERLLALMVAKDAPLGAAQVIAQVPQSGNEVDLRVRLQHATGKIRELSLAMQRDENGWKLRVSEGVIKGYAAALAGSALK